MRRCMSCYCLNRRRCIERLSGRDDQPLVGRWPILDAAHGGSLRNMDAGKEHQRLTVIACEPDVRSIAARLLATRALVG
jgi:hypothetical protein